MDVDRRLSAVLGDFARITVTDFPIQAILDHLVLRIVEVLPIEAAGVSLISPGVDPRYVAASGESALRVEQLQAELGEGPCLASFETGAPLAIPDLRVDSRFPDFAERAVEEGLMGVFTFPLRHGDRQLGALDVYRATAGAMTSEEMDAAQTLADVAAAYLLNAWARDQLKEASDLARYSSLHDALTGLPNRALLEQRLEHAMLRCRRSRKMVAILFVDLDEFKAVNDAYGQHVGDELLAAVAARLSGLLRPGDTLARTGGDEFVVLCEDLGDPAQIEPIAERIDRGFAESFVLSGAAIQTTASVGIAFCGPGDDVPAKVLREADTALYEAKRGGQDDDRIFDLRERLLSDRQSELQRDLVGALARGELRIEYQPIVSTSDRQVTGVEALLRWEHPVLGTIGPTTVVPLAEQSDLISDIGRWMLEQACLDRPGLQRHNHHHRLAVSVNVSVRQLMTPGFAAAVAAVLSDTHTDPRLVTLEITESVFIHDNQRAGVVLNDLKRLGVRIALDDFGTGYSSLSYLQQFPIDIIKMDQTFIAGLRHDTTSRLIIRAVVGLAHALRMEVVAEGVASDEQYSAVETLNCDSYQGFHFAGPTSAEHLESMLATMT